MDWRLDPIYRALPRHAEQTDTRQDILRHEEDSDRKNRRERGQSSDDTALWEDRMEVSITALRAFFETLIHPDTQQPQIQAPASEIVISEAAPGTLPPQTKAALAYQRTQRATAAATPPSAPRAAPSADSNNKIRLSTAEQRAIMRLVEDLDHLAASGVQSLIVLRHESFLESIQIAVKTAKAAL